MYQKLIIVGNLGRDPEMRFTPDGNPVTSFSVATSRRYKDKDLTKPPGSAFQFGADKPKAAISISRKVPKFWLKGACTPIHNMVDHAFISATTEVGQAATK